MPRYDFICKKCGHVWRDVVCSMSEYDNVLRSLRDYHKEFCDGVVTQLYYPPYTIIDDFQPQIVDGKVCETKRKFRSELDRKGRKSPVVHNNLKDVDGHVYEIIKTTRNREDRNERVERILREESKRRIKEQAKQLLNDTD